MDVKIRRDKNGHYRVFLPPDRFLFYRNKRELLADAPLTHLLGQATLDLFENEGGGKR
jgi:hypothetical protein